MAAIDTTRTPASHGLAGRIGSTFARIAAWNDARITRKTLSALSDRELDDIGLARGDIEAVADGKTLY